MIEGAKAGGAHTMRSRLVRLDDRRQETHTGGLWGEADA
jgi:hypothetical protein